MGVPGVEIAERVVLTKQQVSRIRARFVNCGVDGLAERPKGGRKDHALPAEAIEKIVQTALSPPPAGKSR